MSPSVLSVEDRVRWILMYLDVLDRITSPHAAADDPRALHNVTHYQTVVKNTAANVQAHVVAIHAALPLPVRHLDAPTP